MIGLRNPNQRVSGKGFLISRIDTGFS